jgi:hypothetical protein
MKHNCRLIGVMLATVSLHSACLAAEIDYRLPHVSLSVSATLSPAPPPSDPMSRNLAWTLAENCRGASSWCVQSAAQDRRPEMVLELEGKTISRLLPDNIRDAGSARFRWAGSKGGFTEHNLKVRVSRHRAGMYWESKF